MCCQYLVFGGENMLKWWLLVIGLMCGSAGAITLEDYHYSNDGRSLELVVGDLSLGQTVNVSIKGSKGKGSEIHPESVRTSLKIDLVQKLETGDLPLEIRTGNTVMSVNIPAPPQNDLYVLAVSAQSFQNLDPLYFTNNDTQSLIETLNKQRGKLYRNVISYGLKNQDSTRE
jgi:hypothetical protein